MTLKHALVVALALASVAYAKHPRFVLRDRLEAHKLAKLAEHGSAVPPDMYYSNTMNHFDADDTRTYEQRYWVNDSYWTSPDGPVFIYIGGEGALNAGAVLYGEHMALAQEHGALVFALEHRFYGASVPTDTMSDENLSLLSSQQALADLAEFHAGMSAQYKLSGNKWICFGGSYPGALSAWFRLKYPHLVVGAVASSAPVEARLVFEGYQEVVSASLTASVVGGSELCHNNVQAAFATLDTMLGTSNGQKEIMSDFNVCSPFTGMADIVNFATNVFGAIDGIVQYNNEIPGSMNIKDVCNIMTTAGKTPYDNLVALNAAYNKDNEQPCTEVSWADTLAQMQNITVDRSASGVGIRQWMWQSCTQFGYFQVCDKGTSCPFSTYYSWANFEQYGNVCEGAFSISLNETARRIDFTNDYYGGNKTSGTNICFVNGSIDPWHWLSVTKTPYPSEPSVFIDGTAHCANMNPPMADDLPSLTQARAEIATIVAGFLGDQA